MLTDFMSKYEENIKEFIGGTDPVFIYGNGEFSKILQSYFSEERINIHGIFVTQKFKDTDSKVIEYDALKYKDVKIIMSVSEKNQNEIITNTLPSSAQILCLPDKYFSSLKFILSVKTKDANDNWTYLGYKKTLDYLENGSKTVIFRRQSGLGDVLNAEPTCAAVKAEGYRVGFITDYPELFYYNGSVDYLVTSSSEPVCKINNTIYISLHDAHESIPFQHMALSNFKRAQIYIPNIKIREKFIPNYDENLVKYHPLNSKKICMNAEVTVGWDSKLYSHERMREFGLYLKSKGYEIYEVGLKHENYLGVGKNCYGLELHDSAKVMSDTDLYIGLDNGLMHLAEALRIPIFCIFGCTCPLYLVHDWEQARVLWKNSREVPCAACYNRRRIPHRMAICNKDKFYCLDWSVDELIYAFENSLYNNPPKVEEDMFEPLFE